MKSEKEKRSLHFMFIFLGREVYLAMCCRVRESTPLHYDLSEDVLNRSQSSSHMKRLRREIKKNE